MKNIKEGWRTSIIGFAIIVGALASVFVKGASWADASIGIAVGVGLLFTPDTYLKKNSDEKKN